MKLKPGSFYPVETQQRIPFLEFLVPKLDRNYDRIPSLQIPWPGEVAFEYRKKELAKKNSNPSLLSLLFPLPRQGMRKS